MNAIGFNLTKMSVEDLRIPNKPVEGVKINTSMDILSIAEVKSPLKSKDETLTVEFDFKVNYEPDFAKVYIKGKALIALDPKEAKEVMKGWKDKKLTDDFRLFVFNLILRKATLKALELEDELNLPLHMPMPSFRTEEDAEKSKK